MIAVCIDQKRMHEVWPHFRGRIEKAINRVGISEFDRIQRDVFNGHALLWLAYQDPIVHAAAVTTIVDDVLEIVACGGENLRQFLPLLNDLEAYGRSAGCKASRVIGRKGWIRVLKNYKQKAVILQKDF